MVQGVEARVVAEHIHGNTPGPGLISSTTSRAGMTRKSLQDTYSSQPSARPSVAKRQIRVREALGDLRSGMNDSAMMAKHSLDVRGLQSLFRKLTEAGLVTRQELDERMPGFMPSATVSVDPNPGHPEESWKLKITKPTATEGRPVKASDVLRDIRAGVDDHGLMDKYRLSSRGIQDLMDKLVKAGLLTQAEVDDRMPAYDSTVDLRGVIEELQLGDVTGLSRASAGSTRTCPVCGASHSDKLRKCPQCGFGMLLSPRGSNGSQKDSGEFREAGRYLVVPVPVYETRNPRVLGTVSDISERAVGVTGIPAGIEETKTLVVVPEESMMIESFRFRSRCRWTDARKSEHFARFEIVAIAEKDKKNLRELIENLTFGL